MAQQQQETQPVSAWINGQQFVKTEQNFFTDDQFITEGPSVKVLEFLIVRLRNKPEAVIFETAEYKLLVLCVVINYNL